MASKQKSVDSKMVRSNIPDSEIEAIARCLMPTIMEFFESEDGRAEFERWKLEKRYQSNDLPN